MKKVMLRAFGIFEKTVEIEDVADKIAFPFMPMFRDRDSDSPNYVLPSFSFVIFKYSSKKKLIDNEIVYYYDFIKIE